ncbi:MAG: hypothetical protein PHT75_00420 [Bacilli bacterium]|nr:hypothetical protein [Bacilli bacterium]
MKKNKGNKNKTGKVIGVIALAIILGSVFFQGVSGSLEDNKKDKNNEERETVKDDSAYVNIEFIGYNEFKTLYDGSDKTILVLGQKGCGYCDKYNRF